MSLPFTRNETYIAGTTPVSAATMNNLQDYLIALHEQVRAGSNYFLDEEFEGAGGTPPDPNTWNVQGTPVMQGGSGGEGNLYFLQSANGQTYIQNNGMGALTTGDFKFSCRVFVTALGGAGSNITLGAISSAYFLYDATSGGVWKCVHNAVTTATGVAPLLGAGGLNTWQILEIRRYGGVIYFSIDGTVVYTIASTLNMVNAVVDLRAVRATSGTTSMLVDYVKFWHVR